MSERGTQEQMQMPKHGEFCWTEIATTDLEACKKFYSELFGWKIGAISNSDIKMEYLEFDTGAGHSSGGMYKMTKEFFGENIPPSHFMNYITVDDVDSSMEKAKELGATVMGEAHDIPNVGRMCIVKDPTGATFSLITLKGE